MRNNYEWRLIQFAIIFLRIALAAGFLTAVSDRFGLWGPPGTTNVAWGDFGHFLACAAKLNPELPPSWIPAVSWTVTLAETTFAITLILGFRIRLFALLSGLLPAVMLMLVTAPLAFAQDKKNEEKKEQGQKSEAKRRSL